MALPLKLYNEEVPQGGFYGQLAGRYFFPRSLFFNEERADGDYHVVIEDPREDVLKSFEEKIVNGTAEPNDMAMAAGPNLQFITSLAFGGPDLRTAYLGSLAMSTLPTFQSPVAGLPLQHWK